jgi:hypothetical protein
VIAIENQQYTFTAVNFGFTDPNDSPANTLAAVTITTLPVLGSLTLNGVAVTTGQGISVANINSGLLRYTPPVDANGAGHTTHQVIRVRVFTTENGVNFYNFFLPFQGFQIMRKPDEIHFGGQFISRMAPISIGKNAELAAFHKFFDPGLNITEITGRTFGPMGNALSQFGCFFGVRL